MYYCETCNGNVQDSDVIVSPCPWCREEKAKCKICGSPIKNQKI